MVIQSSRREEELTRELQEAERNLKIQHDKNRKTDATNAEIRQQLRHQEARLEKVTQSRGNLAQRSGVIDERAELKAKDYIDRNMKIATDRHQGDQRDIH